MKKLTDHIENIIEIADKIETGKITILTGSNGAGKSLIRKMLSPRIAEKLKLDAAKTWVSQTSMEQRTSSNPEWGALSSIMHDVGWTPTSMETLHKIKNLIKVSKDRYLVIDEPEIGMGEETILGLVNYLNTVLAPTIKNGCLGVMIITHSRLVVENLNHDNFIYIDKPKFTPLDWLNREVVAADLIELEERSSKLHDAIQDRINKNSKKS